MTELHVQQRANFFNQAMNSYLEVTKAMHLFQMEMAKELAQVLTSRQTSIMGISAFKAGEFPEVCNGVSPEQLDDQWDFEECDICAYLCFKEAKCKLFVGIEFAADQTHNLFCAVEVEQKQYHRKWQDFFKGHGDYFDEKWGGHAFGLKRNYVFQNDFENKITAVLDELLLCIET